MRSKVSNEHHCSRLAQLCANASNDVVGIDPSEASSVSHKYLIAEFTWHSCLHRLQKLIWSSAQHDRHVYLEQLAVDAQPTSHKNDVANFGRVVKSLVGRLKIVH